MIPDILQFEDITIIVDSAYESKGASCENILKELITEQLMKNAAEDYLAAA